MPSLPETKKPWRPRFSVRKLVIVITLVCLYLACWEPTKRHGAMDVLEQFMGTVEMYYASSISRSRAPYDVVYQASAKIPLVVTITHPNGQEYYFWFFGYFAKLPYERKFNPTIISESLA